MAESITYEYVGHIWPADLRNWTTQILVRFGFDELAAESTARMLVEADIYGLSSHGVSLMLPRYMPMVERGVINTGSDVSILRETDTTTLLDGQGNLGAPVAEKAVEFLLAKAQKSNVAWVSVRHSNHIGFLAHWVRQIIEQDMIGIAMTNVGPDMAVHGGIDRKLGTNPICIGVPARPFPLVLDMASSAAAMGKIREAALHGKSVPPTWGMDRSGKPTTNPQDIVDGGSLLPLAGHKGSGLAIMIDILCGILSGADYSTIIPPASSTSKPLNIGNFFGAIRIDAFCELGTFQKRMTEFIETLHSLRRLPNVERIYLPGEIEFETAGERQKDGIPIAANTKKALDQMAQEYDVPLPDLIGHPMNRSNT